MKRLALLMLLSLSLTAADPRYVRVQGRDLLAPDGSRLILRGIGLGNWLVPEGYMFQSIPDRHRRARSRRCSTI